MVADVVLPLAPHAASKAMDTTSVARTSQDFSIDPFIYVAPDPTALSTSQTLRFWGHEVIAEA